MSPHVIIAGAGIGGLTAALALLRSGIDCDLYEQAPELREVGAGLQLAPNGTRVLFALGLEPAVRRDGVETGNKTVRLWSTGQTWSLFDPTVATPTERFGSPMYLMHRGDLHAMLVEAVRAVKPGAIHLNSRCADFEQDERQVRLKLEDGRRIAGDVLIGADGLHSRIRQKLFGAGDAEIHWHSSAWRGLAPTEKLPEHLRKPVATQWLGPNGHVTCYPVIGWSRKLESSGDRAVRGRHRNQAVACALSGRCACSRSDLSRRGACRSCCVVVSKAAGRFRPRAIAGSNGQ